MSDDLVNPETHFIAYSLGKLDARVLPVGDPVPAEYYETHLPSLLAEFDECLPTGDAEVATLLVVSQATRIQELEAEVERLKGPRLARHQTCGCVVCVCGDEERCHGCGAKNCGKHPVGEIPTPVYAQSLGDSDG